jgi:hypothetical protein
MMMLKQFSVVADPETGEWLTEPLYVKDVDVAEWDKLEDTPQIHYDCFEWWDSETILGTCAIEVQWRTTP